MIKADSQPKISMQQSIPKHLRGLLNRIFELEQKTVNNINIELIQQEIEQQLLELNKNKQQLAKTNYINRSKRRNKLTEIKKNKLSTIIKNKQQIIDTKQQLLTNLATNKRLIAKMQDCFYIKDNYGSDIHYHYENPINQPYDDRRTDIKANIVGTKTTNLVITEVIKPIIRLKTNNQSQLYKKA